MLQACSTLLPLQAFCQSCPSSESVKVMLHRLGFALKYQMDGYVAVPHHGIPALPAQYHFQEASGTEVIYLAGRDTSTQDGIPLPAHQSRWWIYPGHSSEVYSRVVQTLTIQWSMAWFAVKEGEG